MPAQEKTCFTYTRRQPELTPCYKVIQENLETFVLERSIEDRPLPSYVHEEFDAYLKCGIPAYGFLRLRCKNCNNEKIVAFSCKKRGFCPSCCAKRMAEASTHLVDNILPYHPYRQFVISFPIPMRYWLHTNKKLYGKVHSIVIKEIHKYYIKKAEDLGIKDPTPGAISFTQRFGSALNLNVHIHALFLDGVYIRVKDKAVFRNIDAISNEEVVELLEGVSKKVMKHLKKQGYLDDDGDVVENPLGDDIFSDYESMSLVATNSIAGKIAFGPNAGQYVTKIGSGFGFSEEVPLAKGSRCYSVNGFSLHANTSINTLQRDRLEKLVRYIARGPLSNERLEITEDGSVKLELKTAYSDGSTHLLFSPSEFLEKLTALVPPPKTHLVRWSGVFAPNSPYRRDVVLKPNARKGFEFEESEGGSGEVKKNYSSWHKILARVFKIDVSKCNSCDGDMAVICAVTDRNSIDRYLRSINIDHDPPARSPPRFNQGLVDFGSYDAGSFEEPVIYLD